MKRYKAWMHCREDCEFDEDPEGEWVKFEDYRAEVYELTFALKLISIWAGDELPPSSDTMKIIRKKADEVLFR